MLNSVYKTKAVRPLINYYSPDQFYNLLNLDSETLKDKSSDNPKQEHSITTTICLL